MGWRHRPRMPDSIEEADSHPPGLRLERFRRARKERRRRLAEELLSLQGPISAEGGKEPEEAQVDLVVAEERLKVAQRRLEERTQQSSAEIERLVRAEAQARARAEAAERELAGAQDKVRELTRKLSANEQVGDEHGSARAQLKAALDQRSDANGDRAAEDRLRRMKDRARIAEEQAERAEQLARLKEAGFLRSIDDAELGASGSAKRVPG